MKKLFLYLFTLVAVGAPYQPYGLNDIESLKQTSKAFASVAAKASNSVAYINVEGVKEERTHSALSSPFNDDFFKHFFGDQFYGFHEFNRTEPKKRERRVVGQGSGFVFRVDDGLLKDRSYIMTNNHVIEGADKIKVTFQDGSEHDATIKGSDPKTDIAILEIEGIYHDPLKLGDSSEINVGEWVVAVGNPFGLNHTLTAGIVSAKGRSGLGINDYEDFIQTDAAINPGNSGGPLLDLDGNVIGINTAIFTRTGGYMGVGFAIPANLAAKVADQLINEGKVTRGYLGVVIQDFTKELADSFDLEAQDGILVSQVSKDSAAYKGGIKVGDVIISFKGKDVKDTSSFRNSVALTPPNTKTKLVVLRDGTRKELTVEIGNLEEANKVANDSKNTTEELGITVGNITQELANEEHISKGGVVVTKVEKNSMAYRAGIRAGSIILRVNKDKVTNVDSFKEFMEVAKSKKRLTLLVSDDGMARFITLKW